MESYMGIIFPVASFLMILMMQISFWRRDDSTKTEQLIVKEFGRNSSWNNHDDNKKEENDKRTQKDNENTGWVKRENSTRNNNWRCVCESGFLPSGMLKTFGNAEAIGKLGIGQCYHKQ